jgi:hypothetical protein
MESLSDKEFIIFDRSIEEILVKALTYRDLNYLDNDLL